MRRRTLFALAALSSLLLLCGCRATPVVIRFNDRTIEYERLDSATFPAGVVVKHLDGRIEVTGQEPITVNGREVFAAESTVRIASREFKVGEDDRLIVDPQGSVLVQDRRYEPVKMAPISTLPASADPDSATTSAGATSGGSSAQASAGSSEEDTSWWSFLR